MRFRLCILAILFFALQPDTVFSHPHVFIDNSIKIVFGKEGLAGFEVMWIFDEMFSSMLIHDFDKNMNGKFEAAEIEQVKNGAFSNLKKFQYFTYIKINGKPFRVQFVKGFSATIEEDKVSYHFFVPCHVRAICSFKEVKISIYDKSFYSCLFLTKSPVSFQNASSYDYQYNIGKNTKEPYYFGQIYPEELTIKFRIKDE